MTVNKQKSNTELYTSLTTGFFPEESSLYVNQALAMTSSTQPYTKFVHKIHGIFEALLKCV